MPKDAHSRTSGASLEPLYDVDVATPTHAERAFTLVADLHTGTLCTIAHDPAGYPYGSFTTFALDGPNPVFLISELAEHTKNLRGDPRASLLVAEREHADPLANGRITLLGHCVPLGGDDSTTARAAYLGAYPNAAYYADFKDFGFWKLTVESIRYIGGYGRMSWVDASDWAAATPDPLAPSARGILDHMNKDHSEALSLYCRAFSKASDATDVTMTGVDRYGFEMSVPTPEGPRPVRLAFPTPVTTPDEARKALVALVGEARTLLASPPAS